MSKRPQRAPEQRRRPRDEGFSLVEIMISMFLLTILAVSFLPLLIDSLKTTVRNATIATATQLASEQLDAVALIPRTCAGLDAFESAALATLTDERGNVFTPHRNASTCPSSGYPVSVPVEVWVTVDSDPTIRVGSTTTVIIESAS